MASACHRSFRRMKLTLRDEQIHEKAEMGV
jgi:hypothetical protein